MVKVEIYHCNDQKFNSLVENKDDKINMDELIPLHNESMEKFLGYLKTKIREEKEYLVIGRSSFFTCVRDFVYSNIPEILNSIINSSQLNCGGIIINNPPDRVIQAFKDNNFFEIEDYSPETYELTENKIISLRENLDENIKGQKMVKKHVLIDLSKYMYSTDEKPIILGFIGPQGVGKTIMAKTISDSLFPKGSLFREQMSMLENEASLDYLFGSKPSEKSFSKNLLQRESDVLLLDEFNLLNPNFYSAFYQMFDEGIFVDGYYSVVLKKAIIICTANFISKQEMLYALGPALYSRFTDICVFDELDADTFYLIATNKLETKMKNIKSSYRKLIDKEDILDKIRKHGKFSDVRSLEHSLDQLIGQSILKEKSVL